MPVVFVDERTRKRLELEALINAKINAIGKPELFAGSK